MIRQVWAVGIYAGIQYVLARALLFYRTAGKGEVARVHRRFSGASAVARLQVTAGQRRRRGGRVRRGRWARRDSWNLSACPMRRCV